MSQPNVEAAAGPSSGTGAASSSGTAGTGLKTSPLSPVLLEVQKESGMSVNVSLHPLPILNVSEHLTRTRLQQESDDVQVFGALLGTQSGRDIEIHNTFELRVATAGTGTSGDGDSASGLRIDHEFLKSRQAQFKQVFPSFEFIGWYSIGRIPTPEDLKVHKQLIEYNEAPLFLQLSPSTSDFESSKSAGELPVSVYESVVGMAGGEAAMFFVKIPYRVETGEAERIAVDHTSKAAMGSGSEESSLVANLTTQYNAIKMLSDRIKLVTSYLRGVQSGALPRDHESLRQISALIARLPASDTAEFRNEFLTEYNDVLLTSYLSTMTKGLQSLNELVDKFDLVASGNDDNKPQRGKGSRDRPAFAMPGF